jgi:ABC-type branched-subunit amino acid transport system permease subunit
VYALSAAMGEVGVLLGISIGVLLILLAGLIFSVATTIFNTALYVYATNNQLATGFNEDVMRDAFRTK